MQIQSFLIAQIVSCILTPILARMTWDSERERAWEWKMVSKCVTDIIGLADQTNTDNIIIVINIHPDDPLPHLHLPIPAYYTQLFQSETLNKYREFMFRKGVIVITSTLPIPTVLLNVWWSDRSKFILIPRENYESREIFRDFWEQRIVDVVCLEQLGQAIHITSYFPHTSRSCSGGGTKSISEILSVVVGKWSDKVKQIQKVFPNKAKDWNGCPMRITVRVRPPEAVLSKTGHISGVEVDIMNLVAKSMNATPEFSVFRDQPWHKNVAPDVNLLMMSLVQKDSDVVIGALMFTESVSYYSEAVDYSGVKCVTFAVPKAPSPRESAQLIPTSLAFGSLTILSFRTVAIALWLLIRKYGSNYAMYNALKLTVAPLMGETYKVPRERSASVVCFFWMWGCFFICKILETHVHSSIIAPKPAKELQTINDILQGNFAIAGEIFLLQEVLAPYSSQQQKTPYIAKDVSITTALQMISDFGNITFFGTTENILSVMSENPVFQKKIYLQDCSMQYLPVIQTAKNSPFVFDIRRRVRALSEFGITRYLVHHSQQETAKQFDRLHQPPSPFLALSLSELSIPFYVLLAGLSLSILVLGIEMSLKEIDSCLKRRYLPEPIQGSKF